MLELNAGGDSSISSNTGGMPAASPYPLTELLIQYVPDLE